MLTNAKPCLSGVSVNNQDVESFRRTRKREAELSNVLGERDDVPVRFVMPDFAHPHEEAGDQTL
jgi:hypothetical protein